MFLRIGFFETLLLFKIKDGYVSFFILRLKMLSRAGLFQSGLKLIFRRKTHSLFFFFQIVISLFRRSIYISTVCRDEISTHPARTDFSLRLHGEIKFYPGKAEQFSTWYLLRFLILRCKHVLNYFFILLRWAEAITWENFALAKWDPDRTGIPPCRNETFYM